MILDVGCGRKAKGDVNVDLLVPDSLKGWDQDVSGIKNFVKADVRFLPFKDRVFDMVYCAHVIEHLDDEWEGINELKRVSRKYVAVIVPFASLHFYYDLIWNWKGFAESIIWLRKHHKHFWNMDPFKTGSFRLMWRKADDRNRKNKFKVVSSWIPVPYETLTVWRVDQSD